MKQYNEKLITAQTNAMKMLAAFGDENRLKILAMFEDGETLSLKDLVDSIPLSRNAITHHVNILREAGILDAVKDGREILLTFDKKFSVKILQRFVESIS